MDRQVVEASPESGVQMQVRDLYADHHGWLQGWLRRRLADREHAADIAQDTFLRLLATRRLPGFGQGRQYLLQIARNLVIDQWRRQRIEQAYLDTLAHAEEAMEPSPETRALIMETLMRIDRMLDAMPARVREAFLLSQFEGLGYAQIAERLNVSLSAVQKYMTRAIQSCYAVMYSE